MLSRTHWGWSALLDAARRPLPWPEEMLYLGPEGLGDTLVALPTLRRIRRVAPNTRVTWMARTALEPIARRLLNSYIKSIGKNNGNQNDQ